MSGFERWYDPAEPSWAAEPTHEWQPQFPGQRYAGDIGVHPGPAAGTRAVVGRAGVRPVSPAAGDPYREDGEEPRPDGRIGWAERRSATRGPHPTDAPPHHSRERRGWDDGRPGPDGRRDHEEHRPRTAEQWAGPDGHRAAPDGRRGWEERRGTPAEHRPDRRPAGEAYGVPVADRRPGGDPYGPPGRQWDRRPEQPLPDRRDDHARAGRPDQRGPEWTVDRDRTGWHGDRPPGQRWTRAESVGQAPVSPAPRAEPGWLPEPDERAHRPAGDARPGVDDETRGRARTGDPNGRAGLAGDARGPDGPAHRPVRREPDPEHGAGRPGPRDRQPPEVAARAETHPGPVGRPAPERDGGLRWPEPGPLRPGYPHEGRQAAQYPYRPAEPPADRLDDRTRPGPDGPPADHRPAPVPRRTDDRTHVAPDRAPRPPADEHHRPVAGPRPGDDRTRFRSDPERPPHRRPETTVPGYGPTGTPTSPQQRPPAAGPVHPDQARRPASDPHQPARREEHRPPVEQGHPARHGGDARPSAPPPTRAAAPPPDRVPADAPPARPTSPPRGHAPAPGIRVPGATVSGAPVSGGPVSGVPGSAAPTAGAPVSGPPMPFPDGPVAGPPSPVSGAPVSSAPISGAPVSGTPVSSAPISGAPVSGAPVSGAPGSGAPAAGTAGPPARPEEPVSGAPARAAGLPGAGPAWPGPQGGASADVDPPAARLRVEFLPAPEPGTAPEPVGRDEAPFTAGPTPGTPGQPDAPPATGPAARTPAQPDTPSATGPAARTPARPGGPAPEPVSPPSAAPTDATDEDRRTPPPGTPAPSDPPEPPRAASEPVATAPEVRTEPTADELRTEPAAPEPRTEPAAGDSPPAGADPSATPTASATPTRPTAGDPTPAGVEPPAPATATAGTTPSAPVAPEGDAAAWFRPRRPTHDHPATNTAPATTPAGATTDATVAPTSSAVPSTPDSATPAGPLPAGDEDPRRAGPDAVPANGPAATKPAAPDDLATPDGTATPEDAAPQGAATSDGAAVRGSAAVEGAAAVGAPSDPPAAPTDRTAPAPTTPDLARPARPSGGPDVAFSGPSSTAPEEGNVAPPTPADPRPAAADPHSARPETPVAGAAATPTGDLEPPATPSGHTERPATPAGHTGPPAEPTAAAPGPAGVPVSAPPARPVSPAPAGRSDLAGQDPEQVLAAVRWRLDPATLREDPGDPELLRTVRDRLTAKLGAALDNRSRARLLSLRAVVSRILGNLDDALADGRLALTYAEATGELRRTALARARLAQVLRWRGDHAEADRLFAEANSAELPDRLRAALHEHTGRSCYDQGRLMEACHHFERALDLGHEADPELVARVRVGLDAVRDRVAEHGFGPYPRGREEILGTGAPVPAWDEQRQRWGYADADGDLVIPGEYAEAQPFREGLAWVRRPEATRWTLIDPAGAVLIESNNGYRAVGPFSAGLAWVSMDGAGNWMAVDPTNIVRIPPGFEEVRPFRGGVAAVRRGGWGAVDRAGQLVVPTRYQGFATALVDGRPVDGFTEEGLAVVEANGRRGVVDRAGRMLVEPVWPTVLIHPVAFLVVDGAGRWGALDRHGAPLIDPVHRDRAGVLAGIDRLLTDATPVL
ncbi:WG repeat-containing protein [Micromonospora sp. NPDC050686]|uniref:WG repeat-containing protein n=1 Tax=Micromonospora sp. NPDC050686 TaxID=3154631 RepID=UPI0033EAAC80